MPLAEPTSAMLGKLGRLLPTPRFVQGDRGYDHDKCRRMLYEQGIPTFIAWQGGPAEQRLV